jgi:peptidoglycan/xylan/chitin deacetylase (PgdA/CDA1 family)
MPSAEGVPATAASRFRLVVPILYYHLIGAPPEGATRNSIWMEPASFDRQLGLLRRLGYRDITPGEFMNCLEAGRRPEGRRVMITFDDGHLDNFTVARPILMRHGFRAVIFVVAGSVGGRLRLRSGVNPAGEPIMSANQLRELAREGHCIASHGMTHANLAQMDDAAARDEIERSKSVLEAIVERPVRYYSFPYGSFRPEHLAMVERAGYRAAFSTVRGRSHALAERFCLKRIPIHHGTGRLGLLNALWLKSYRRAQARLDRQRRGECP